MAFDPSTATEITDVPKKTKFDPSTATATEGQATPKEVKEVKPTLLERGKRVGEEALTGGIYGAFAPEMMEASGGAIRSAFGGLPGPIGRGASGLGSALVLGGEAMRAYRPASMAVGTLGGATGEITGQAVESQYGPGVSAELGRLLGATLGPVPLQALGSKTGRLVGTLLSKVGVPGMGTAKTVGQLLQEEGIKPGTLTETQKDFIKRKIEDIRGGKPSLEAEKEISNMLKQGAQKVTQTAERQALELESNAQQQYDFMIREAQDKAQRIRQNALSQSPSVRQIAEIEANNALQQGQSQAKQILDNAKKQAVDLRSKSGRLTTKTEQETQKAKGEIKQIGQDKELTDIFDPVQKKTIEKQQKFIEDRDALDKDLRQAQQKIVNANESKGVTVEAMPTYKEIDALTKPFDVATSPTILKNTDPGVLSFYKRIRDSIISKTYELNPEQAQIARNLGYNVQEIPSKTPDGQPTYQRKFNSSFEAVDDARRFVGEIFKNPIEGYGAVKGLKEQNVYELLSRLQQEYVGAAEQKALQKNWSEASKNLEQFDTKAGRLLTSIEEGTTQTAKAPAELGTRFFGNRTGVEQLISLTGDESLVKKTAGDYVVNNLKNKDAKGVRDWLQNAKNSDFLSHPSLSELKTKVEQYFEKLARAEKFGEARGSLSKTLGTEMQALPIKAEQKATKVLTEAEKEAARLEQQRIKLGAKGLRGEKAVAAKQVPEATKEAEDLTKPMLAQAKDIRSEAQKTADLITAGDKSGPARVRNLINSENEKELAETAKIISSTSEGKKKFAEAFSQVIADKVGDTGANLGSVIKEIKYINERLVRNGLLDTKTANDIETKLKDVFVAPVDVRTKVSMTQRLLRNALIGYVGPGLARLGDE